MTGDKDRKSGFAWIDPKKSKTDWIEVEPNDVIATDSTEPTGKTYGRNESIKAMLYEDRKQTVEHYWELYKQSADKNGNGDVEALAIICERLPFFENNQVGLEIARRLRGADNQNKRGHKKGIKRVVSNKRIIRINKELQRMNPDWQKQERARELLSMFPDLSYRAIFDLID